jgi:hypothetical protein
LTATFNLSSSLGSVSGTINTSGTVTAIPTIGAPALGRYGLWGLSVSLALAGTALVATAGRRGARTRSATRTRS